jgi:hypothetical protein
MAYTMSPGWSMIIDASSVVPMHPVDPVHVVPSVVSHENSCPVARGLRMARDHRARKARQEQPRQAGQGKAGVRRPSFFWLQSGPHRVRALA